MTESILTTAGSGSKPGVNSTEQTDIAMEPIDQQEEDELLEYVSPDEIEPSQPPPVAGHSRKDQNERQSVTDRTSRRDEARKGNQNRRADELRKEVHNRKDQSRVGEETCTTDQNRKRYQIGRKRRLSGTEGGGNEGSQKTFRQGILPQVPAI